MLVIDLSNTANIKGKCITSRYQQKQNTLYPQRWQVLRRQFFEAYNWSIAYNLGEGL